MDNGENREMVFLILMIGQSLVFRSIMAKSSSFLSLRYVMTFLGSWHPSSCLVHITKCSTSSSSRRRFSSNLLSHRNVLTTKKSLGPCEPKI